MENGQEKNKIEGAMKNIGTVEIGDKTTNIYQIADRKLPKELTINLPKTHPDDIIGRENDLADLHSLLCKEKRVVLLNGLGGIGKTTLAQAYISRYYDEYMHIGWIAQDSDNVANDFVNTLGLIENLNIQQAEFQPQQLFSEVIRKLKSITDKPNLLIIDNAEQSIKECLNVLPSQPDWHLLVTSREEIRGLYPKALDFLSLEDAIELFKKHYTHKKLSEEDIKELVTMVDRHTLTIEIMAKTAEELRYDADTLKNSINDDLKANLDVAHNRNHPEIDKITSYLGTVFNLSNLTEAEIWLMKQFVCLPIEFHGYDLLEEILINGNDIRVADFIEDLNSLARKGWLLQNKETDSYKIHRIIANVAKKQQTIVIADVVTLLDTITSKLALDQTSDNPADKFAWIPFGKALSVALCEETSPEITIFLNNLASRLQDLGDYRGAKVLFERILTADEMEFGENHVETAITYSNLAVVLQDLGDYHGAKKLLEKATASAEKNFGVDDPTTAIRYSNLASVLQDLANTKGQRSYSKKLLHLMKRISVRNTQRQ